MSALVDIIAEAIRGNSTGLSPGWIQERAEAIAEAVKLKPGMPAEIMAELHPHGEPEECGSWAELVVYTGLVEIDGKLAPMPDDE